MTGYCALPSHFSQASLTPNHILKTASLTGGCSPWVLLHYFTRLNTMLWTPGCPQITCWQAIPLARVKGGFNCDGVSIGQAYTKALYRKYQNRNTKQSLHHSQPLPTTSFLLLLTTCQCQLPINQSSHCQLPPNPHRQEKSQASCLVLFECSPNLFKRTAGHQ